eukprot:2253742-Prorocentrum_lima.AAC.1
MTSSLVGSEMCIRDRKWGRHVPEESHVARVPAARPNLGTERCAGAVMLGCLLYTSDAADDM